LVAEPPEFFHNRAFLTRLLFVILPLRESERRLPRSMPRADCRRRKATDRDSTGRRLVCANNSGGANGALVRLGPQQDSGRGNVAALRFVPRIQPDRLAVVELAPASGGADRPGAGGRVRACRLTGVSCRARRRVV